VGGTPEDNWRQVRDVLIDIWSVLSFFYSVQTAAYTTTGNVAREVVICNSAGSITVSLHDTPRDGDLVTVKRQGAGAVTIDTAGSDTIDGGSSISLASQYDYADLLYTDAAAEWSTV